MTTMRRSVGLRHGRRRGGAVTVALWLAVMGVAAAWSACATAADPNKGRALYNTHCQNCHGANGTGQLPGMPNFARGDGLFKPDMEVVRAIKSGKGMMPAFQGILSDNDFLDLVSYLRTLR